MEFEEFVNLFRQTTIQDKDVVEKASEKVLSLRNTNIQCFLTFLSNFLNLPDNTITHRIACLIMLKNTLYPSYSTPIQLIEATWKDINFSDTSTILKTTVLPFILDDNETVRELASQVVANILLFESNNWADLFPLLDQTLNEQETDVNSIMGIEQTYIDIFHVLSPDECYDISKSFPEQFEHLFISLIGFIENEDPNIKPKEKALECLEKMIQILCKAKKSSFFNSQEKIDQIMSTILKTLPRSNQKMFEYLFKIQYDLLSLFYSKAEYLRENIYHISQGTFENCGPEFVIIALDFWAQFAVFENKVRIQAQTESSKIEYLHICDGIIEGLVPAILDIFDNSEFSTALNPEYPSSHACDTLMSLLLLNSQMIFEIIGDGIPDMLEGENPCRALLCLYSILSSAFSSDIARGSLRIIAELCRNEDPNVAQLAMKVETKLFSKYPEYIGYNSEHLTNMFELAQHVANSVPNNLLDSIILLESTIKASDESIISPLFEDITNFLISLSENSHEISRYSINTLNTLINLSPELEQSQSLLVRVVDYIRDAVNTQSGDEIFLNMLCTAVSTIVDSKDIPRELLVEISEFFFDVLDNAEPLRISAFGVLGTLAGKEVVDMLRFHYYVELGLSSDSPELIGAAAESFGQSVIKGHVSESVNETIAHIIHIITEEASEQYAGVYCRLLRSITFALRRLGREFPEDARTILLEIVDKQLSAFVNTRSENEVSTFCDISIYALEALTAYYGSLIDEECFKPEIIKMTKQIVFGKYLKRLWREKLYDDLIIYHSINLIITIADKLKTSVNVQVRLAHVKGIISEGKASLNNAVATVAQKAEIAILVL